VLATTLFVVLALAWTASRTPLYSSSASVLINQANASDLFDPVSTGNAAAGGRQVATEARFFTSGIVSDEAIDRLNFEAFVDVSQDSSADVLTVRATSPDPVEAQTIAQTYAEAYVDVREERFASERTATANELAERLADIDLEIATAAGADLIRLQSFRGDVAESLDLLNLTAGLAADSGIIIIDNASLPEDPFQPRTARNMALGLILGLMTGAGLVLLLEALDHSVKDRETLESLTPGAPNLAVIPALGKSIERRDMLVSKSDPNGLSAEAFRTLRAGLQYVAVDDSAHVIQIASAHSAAGKTTVAANLAITLAQAGYRVVVMDADLRRPRLHQLFDTPQVPGLTSVIIGTSSVNDCIQRVVGDNGSTLYVLPSGPIPPGPAELLGSSAGEKAIRQISKAADYVIIDTPPVLPVADTVVLSRYVDASILVVDASKTTQEDVTFAFERLGQAGAPVIGTVLNRVKRSFRVGGYGYGYGGYGGYAPADDVSQSKVASWFSRSRTDSAHIERLSDANIPRPKVAKKDRPEARTKSGVKADTAKAASRSQMTPNKKPSAPARTTAAQSGVKADVPSIAKQTTSGTTLDARAASDSNASSQKLSSGSGPSSKKSSSSVPEKTASTPAQNVQASPAKFPADVAQMTASAADSSSTPAAKGADSRQNGSSLSDDRDSAKSAVDDTSAFSGALGGEEVVPSSSSSGHDAQLDDIVGWADQIKLTPGLSTDKN